MNCLGKTQYGQPCRSHVRFGSNFCFFLDPASRQRREAQSKGGGKLSRLEAIPAPPCDFDLKEPGEIAHLLNLVANRLVNGQMEPKVAYAIGYVLSLALKLKDGRELDEQTAQAKSERMIARTGFRTTLHSMEMGLSQGGGFESAR